MAVYKYGESSSPLTVELDTGGYGGLSLLGVWVKDAGDATFQVCGSCTGEDGTWRELDELKSKENKGKYKCYSNPYRHIRVSTDSETESEIEIVAG